ncbi:hypothetical protein TNCV_2495011 [Trichonephila clavipes]|nr:hypothetical protein TNCV_2495011 [Trichonephila clavipes]
MFLQEVGGSTWTEIYVSDKPCEKVVKEFRLAVGQDCLADLLHCISIFENPNCPLCKKDEVMDRNNLLECSALRGDFEVIRYWSARHLLMGH